jgi:hypothetical protein
MASNPKEYERLPGRGIRRQGFLSFAVTARRVQLWLGQNHLLSVESQWYTEHYRRFHYRDIQTVIIRKTNEGKITNLVLGIFALIFFSGAIIATDGWQIAWGILTGTLAIFLLLNTLSGPTSVCHLRTAVQTEEMPSLRRLRRARKVLDRLRPLITAAQGQLAPEEIGTRLAQSGGSSASAGGGITSPATAPSAPPPPAE